MSSGKDYWLMSGKELEELANKYQLQEYLAHTGQKTIIDRQKIIDQLIKRDNSINNKEENTPMEDAPTSKWWQHPTVRGSIITGIVAILVPFIIWLLSGNTPKVESKNGVAVGRDIRDSNIIFNNFNNDRLRPSMIFDQKETILDDNGASDYIEIIDVIPKEISGYDIIQSIVIYPKMYLETIPLLEPQPNASYAITSEERGKKFEIIYNLKEVGFVRTEPNPKFRLEIRNPPLINGRK